MDKPVRIVASYTTLPTRYDLLKTSILSLKAQTRQLDAIYVAIPYRAARLKVDYPPIPDDLAQLCTVVRVETDYGPLTKIYGALLMESDPDTIIMSCDDDVLFEPNQVEALLVHQLEYPKSAVCSMGALIGLSMFFISVTGNIEIFRSWAAFFGFPIPKEGRRVDLVYGSGGVMYKRGFFPVKDRLHEDFMKYSLEDSALFHNDDVLISGHLCKNGIERRIFFDTPSVNHMKGDDALSTNFMRMLFRMRVAINNATALGFFPTTEQVSIDETPTGKVLIALIIIIVIIVLCVFLYKALGNWR
jgi:hypothetical protein